MATLVFCHGKESGPQGYKIKQLTPLVEEFGWQLLSPDFTDLPDPEMRLERLLALVRPLPGPLFLVGSSMGGYVAARASSVLEPAGLLLLAPAVGLTGYADPQPRPVAGLIEVVHGWQDKVVPARQVIGWCADNSLHLHLVDDEHSLTGSLPFLQERLRSMLTRFTDVSSRH